VSAYQEAGVDVAAGARAVALMRSRVAAARRPEVVEEASGFAGLFDASSLSRYRRPLLASSTDGVGTKVELARRTGIYDTVGHDLVGMVVDDLVVCGAEPLFLTDYIACGRVIPERIAEIVGGVAAGCVVAGCALTGGETAEHPGLLEPDAFDLAGAATGVVEADAVLGPGRVREGDVVLALAASGPHANGYSLVRRILRDTGLALETALPELARPLGEELLTPTRIYARDCLALAADGHVHAFAHITGGGLADNLARSLPPSLDAVLDRASWTPPAIFEVLAGYGRVDQPDMEATFNMGVGMVAVVAADRVEAALSLLAGRGVPGWPLGEVIAGSGRCRLRGSHP
jgi:phosphoribosylformylglycinamidine cyclo-ligase